VSYNQTIKYLFSQLPMFQRQGKVAFKKDLTNSIKLCNALNNPQKKLKFVHIAGTNGKGTVAHILAAFFQKNKLKTGLYTSPHYTTFRERIKVNGKLIKKKDVVKFVEENKAAIQTIKPSFFEITVAMAFDYFAKQNADIVVLETGLGGRLDSTNIVKPILSIITNIGLDHTDMLGDTKAKIALEKAGIIKKDIPVVIGKKDKDYSGVFNDKAQEKNSPIYFAEEQVKVEILKNDFLETEFAFENKTYKCDLSGPFVQENITTSLAAIEVLKKYYPSLNLKNKNFAKKIIKKTNYKGRWHIINTQPLTIADAAHNFDALHSLFKFIDLQKIKKVHCIIGFVKDKNLNDILNILPSSYTFYLCAAKIKRSLAVDVLVESFVAKKLKFRKFDSVSEAYTTVNGHAKEDELILVCGSSFVVGEVLEEINKTK